MDRTLETYIIANKEKLYRLAYSYVRNQEDALDVVQESIYKALSHQHTMENPAAVKTWMYRIVVHTALDFIRKNKKISYLTDEMIENRSAKEDAHENFDLSKAMQQLSPKHRTVIILRFFEDMKLDDIAQVLDENVNTVKTRLYKALKLLKIQLDDVQEEVRQ